jgi:hypothetical protein
MGLTLEEALGEASDGTAWSSELPPYSTVSGFAARADGDRDTGGQEAARTITRRRETVHGSTAGGDSP